MKPSIPIAAPPPTTFARLRTLQGALRGANPERDRRVRGRAAELERLNVDATHMLGEAGSYNDTDTGLHIWRMAAYASALAHAAGWPEEDRKLLELAVPMHGSGKFGISDAVLKKPAKFGHDIPSKSESPLFRMATEIALCQHEKWNGTGYPRKLAGAAIPESARIVAVADVFDALTMRHPYKPSWPVDKAMGALRQGAGSHFDPGLVDLFEGVLPEILAIRREWNERERSAAA